MHVHASDAGLVSNDSVPRLDRLFMVGVALNLAYAGIEAGLGVLNGSLALVADAGHNLTDVLGLGLAWLGVALARSKPTREKTYGLRKGSVLAALTSSLLIYMAMGMIAWEAIKRLGTDVTPPGQTIMIVAGVGVLVNLVTAFLFFRGRKRDLNLKGAFLHMMADAAVSAGVVVAGIAVILTGWTWIDPTVSLVIAAIIGIGTWSLLSDSLHLAVDGVPRDIDIAALRAYLLGLPGVTGVHDLHVWGSSTTESVLTAHLSMKDDGDEAALLQQASDGINKEFGVGHTTLQIERNSPCPANQPCEPQDLVREFE